MVEAVVATILMRRMNDISESSSDSDEEWERALRERGKRRCRPRITDYIHVVNRYRDNEFKSHFRMSRATFEFLHGILHEDLTRGIPGSPNIPSNQQLMVSLWKMATMDSYRSVCDRFNVGKATAIRAVRRVTRALFIQAPRFIQWPRGDSAIRVMQEFQRNSGFPGIIGAIDGTHIHIDAPKENHNDYINRKQFHSIQLQLVCDNTTRITHAYAGHPGSVHDQRVFRLSEVADYINEDEKFPGHSHIVGDGAYEINQHLLVPFRNNGHLTERQRNYNYRLSAARVTVERCIGLLKGRMRSLLHCLPMTRVDLMPEYIIACCVIHNICTIREDQIDVIVIPENGQEHTRGLNLLHAGRHNVGIQKRNLIMNDLPN